MKKFILALSATVCLLPSDAKVWRVNNNAGISADFSNLSTAVTNAAAGDTLLLEGSVADYSTITLNKKLTITGPGYFLADATPNPYLQYNKNSATIGGITFAPGSKGSVVQGCVIGTVLLDDSLVTLQRNRLASAVNLAPNNNIYGDTLRNNYFQSYFSSNSTGKKCVDLLVYNNIFSYHYIISLNSSAMNNVNGYFINNTFVGSSSRFECVAFVFQNNIFSNTDFATYQSSNTFFNNVVQNAGIPTGNGNLLSVNLANVFNGWSSGTGFSSDGRYQLKAGSPASGAGVLNGSAVDCGAFGGPAPYILSGMPPIPSIYDLNAPAQVIFGTNSVNVNISAAAH